MRRLRVLVSSLLPVVAAVPVALAATHTVNQTNLTFVSDDITIQVGDTVEWVHSSGFHTVTNGTGPTDPLAGTLFELSLSSGTVSHTFTSGGDVPYFCRPHFGVGMTAIVRVEDGVLGYIMQIVRATRGHRAVALGGSPRAGLMLLMGAKSLARFADRDFVTPDDIKAAFCPALRHRVVLSASAELEGATADDVLLQILEAVEVPR